MNTSLRVAGWGTLGFAIAFVVTFAVNATLETIIDDPKLPTAADMAADFRGGVVFILLWGSAGVTLILIVALLGFQQGEQMPGSSRRYYLPAICRSRSGNQNGNVKSQSSCRSPRQWARRTSEPCTSRREGPRRSPGVPNSSVPVPMSLLTQRRAA